LREGNLNRKRVMTEALRVVAIAALVCCLAVALHAQEWERIGPEGGNAISLAVTGDGEVLLGTPDGHVFASSDGGERWALRGRVGNRPDGVAQRLVTDLRGKTRVFAAVWTQDPAAGGGVFRSEDGGRTWTASGLQGEAVRAMAQSASSPDVFVAGTRTGVFRSADAGKNWERISPAGDEELRNLDSIAIDPRDANVIYLGTYHLPWKTTDGGKSWKPIAAGMIDDSDVMSVVIDRSDPERIFASACSGIYRSGNGGAQWTKLQGIPYVSRRTQQIAQDPRNAAVWYAGTTEGLWRSKDGGESWERLTGRDAVVNAIAFAEKGARLLLGTEDGILLSMDSGKTFAARNFGFAHPVVRAFAVSETDSRHLVVAVEGEAGLRESIDEGKSWRVFSGPAAPVNVLFSIGDNWYAALRGGGAAQFDTKTGKWKEIRFMVMEMARNSGKGGSTQAKQMRERILKPEVSAMKAVGGRLFVATGNGLWAGGTRAGVLQRALGKQFAEKVMDLAVDSAGSELLAIAQDRLWRSVDGAKTWETANAPENAGDLLWMRMAGGERRAVLVGARNGVFARELGTGLGEKKDWRLLQSGLPAAASWAPVMSERFWMIPMRAGGVYLSKDRGRSWERLEMEGFGLVQSIALAGSVVWAKTQTDGLFVGSRP
jgi:photosystem II stability/assembly factor-like uncharacterized protein